MQNNLQAESQFSGLCAQGEEMNSGSFLLFGLCCVWPVAFHLFVNWFIKSLKDGRIQMLIDKLRNKDDDQ